MSADLLTPELAGRLHNLDLVARLVVEGFLTGLHRSPYHGFSAEFAEYRQYIPGESIANLDWRVFAKTDKHYLKVFAEETNLRATLLVDCSASMRFTAGGRPTKLHYARLLSASLAYLLLRQNDAVGLVTFDEKPLSFVPARSVRRQLFRVLKELDHARAGGGTALGPVLHRVAERIHRRGLVVLCSDLMDDPASVLAGLKHFRHRGHEVIVFHILDPREVDLDFEASDDLADFHGSVEFVSLETPDDSLRAEPAHLQAAYRRRFDTWRGEIRRECRRQRINLVEVGTDTPLDHALGQYLRKRRRML